MNLNEYKKEDIKFILSELTNYFTIGFEIEIETDKNRVKSLRDVPYYESVEMYPSRQNRKMMEDFKFNFPEFYQKYKNIISFHDDETLFYGIEIVNKPFNNIKESIKYITDFFLDFEDQNRWNFTHRTSIHVNIGTYDKSDMNIIKGILMISDQDSIGYTYKGIEKRLTTYCSSMKEKLLKILKKENNYGLLYSNDIKYIENILNEKMIDIYDFYGGFKAEMAGAKLFGIIPKKDYIEFRYLGSEDLTEEITKDKIIYFCYIIYLMSTEYRNKEYVRKLFSFINKLR